MSAGGGGVLCCHVEEMKAYGFAQQSVIRPVCAAGLDVFFQKIVVLMCLWLVSERYGAKIIDMRQIQTCGAKRQSAEFVLNPELLDF